MSILTLTGIDEKTDVTWLDHMNGKFRLPSSGRSGLEFGILLSPKEQPSPRYVSYKTLQRFRLVYPHTMAYHLCGGYARMVLTHNWQDLGDMINFELINRVQVNTRDDSAEAIVALQQFSAHIGKSVIMQWRHDFFPYIANLSLLQDNSGGRGVLEKNWISRVYSSPLVRVQPVGYAGGLGPDNIRDELPRIVSASKGNFWIDCESSLRTDDWFDQDKAEAMATAVWETLGWKINN